jgi:hypothetical protein
MGFAAEWTVLLRPIDRVGSLASGRLSLGGTEMTEKKPDVERLVEEGAKIVGLPIADEYRAGVALNMERTLTIVRPLLELELDDALIPAPVFRP